MEEIKWAKCKSKKKWKRSDGPVAIDKAFGPSENVKAQRDRLEMERAVTKGPGGQVGQMNFSNAKFISHTIQLSLMMMMMMRMILTMTMTMVMMMTAMMMMMMRPLQCTLSPAFLWPQPAPASLPHTTPIMRMKMMMMIMIMIMIMLMSMITVMITMMIMMTLAPTSLW